MLINKLINAFTIYNLGKRYFRAQRVDVLAIKRIKAQFYEQMWHQAAAQAEATIEPLGAGIFKITKGTASIKVYQQYPHCGDSVTDRFILNKKSIFKQLAKIKVPIPRYLHLKDLDASAAKSFMTHIGRPLVVKPCYGTGAGAGVTTNVTGARRLFQALAWSRAFCPETVIEEQIKGDNYRLLLLDGELLDCIIRHPPTVIGDGLSSIRRLICQENKERVESGSQLAQALIFMDLDTKFTLEAQGLNLRSKPEKGQAVKVKDVINSNRAEDNETPSRGPAESLIRLGRKISETIGVSLVGIDIITEDLTSDLEESGGVVIEVNTPPGHFYHHLKKGGGYSVAKRLLQHAFVDRMPDRQQFKTLSPRKATPSWSIEEHSRGDSI